MKSLLVSNKQYLTLPLNVSIAIILCKFIAAHCPGPSPVVEYTESFDTYKSHQHGKYPIKLTFLRISSNIQTLFDIK